LKECEFRFNYGTPKQQLNTLKRWCNLSSQKRKAEHLI
jgi:transposase